jgi:hypothetical protein
MLVLGAPEKEVIGFWRFRELDKQPKWCSTFCYRGRYYDVSGYDTISACNRAVRDQLAKLRRRESVKRKAKRLRRLRVTGVA